MTDQELPRYYRLGEKKVLTQVEFDDYFDLTNRLAAFNTWEILSRARFLKFVKKMGQKVEEGSGTKTDTKTKDKVKSPPAEETAPAGTPFSTDGDSVLTDERIQTVLKEHSKYFTKLNESDNETIIESIESLMYYHHGESSTANIALRAGDDGEFYGQSIKPLFDKAPKLKANATVFRGIRGAFAEGLKVGDIYHEKGFMSTSFKPDVAAKFAASGSLLKINVPKGQQGLFIDALKMIDPDMEDDEFEFLLPPGAKLKITKEEMVNGVRQLTVTLMKS